MLVLWLKAFHIISMVAWMAGIFYLPRLFVYHSMCAETDTVGIERFKLMERKLFWSIMTPSAVVTIGFGVAMLYQYGLEYVKTQHWLHAKLLLVVLLCAYHIYCYFLMKDFERDQNKRGHVFYRVFNEVPVLFLIGIVIIVIVKPF